MRVAARDPASELHAVLNGWKYPISREGMLLLDLIDVTGSANSSKKRPWKPVPRPWKTGQTFGTTAISVDDARVRLSGRGDHR